MSVLDLSIFVVPDISAFAPKIREQVEKYFQDAIAKKGLKGSFRIDPAQWDPQYRTVAPKCAGISLNLDSVVERALVMIQHDQASQCIEVGLGELFGLINIRKYYTDHGRDVPTDLVSLALRTLYDKRVGAGMSLADATRAVGEICR